MKIRKTIVLVKTYVRVALMCFCLTNGADTIAEQFGQFNDEKNKNLHNIKLKLNRFDE
jgi:hypothetical protein